MSKWYVVKYGRRPGIYQTWEECKAQTDGFSGAVFKSFVSEWEAKAYFRSSKNNVPKEGLLREQNIEKHNRLLAYTDGSFTKNGAHKPLSGYGVVFVINDNIVGESCGECHMTTSIRNIGGELKAATRAIEMAIECGYKEVIICHDLQNIQMWGNGLWNANIEETKQFQQYVKKTRHEGMVIHFAWVKGHDGNKFNVHADMLAGKGANGKHIDYLLPNE